MKDEIGALIGDSIKFGAESAEHEAVGRPIAADRAVDANGNKITEHLCLRFADPIVTEFDKSWRSCRRLIDKIAGPLTTAITAKPQVPDQDFTITGHWDIPRQPDYASHGRRHGQRRATPGRRRDVLPFGRAGRTPCRRC